jgi:hypothetical protein
VTRSGEYKYELGTVIVLKVRLQNASSLNSITLPAPARMA